LDPLINVGVYLRKKHPDDWPERLQRLKLGQELAPFASQQFREIWVSVDPGGPRLCALMNTNVGWLTSKARQL